MVCFYSLYVNEVRSHQSIFKFEGFFLVLQFCCYWKYRMIFLFLGKSGMPFVLTKNGVEQINMYWKESSFFIFYFIVYFF